MTIEVGGSDYYSVGEIATEVGVSRQTLWRWRRAGKIPPGNRFRNGQVLYTDAERYRIYEYANRLEPLDTDDDRQLTIFE